MRRSSLFDKGWQRSAVLVGTMLLGLLVGLVIVEMAVRAYPPRDHILLSLPSRNFERSDVPGIPYLPRRNAPGWTNNLGLRSLHDATATKPPGTFRLLVVGDSVTATSIDNVSPDRLYPAVLEGLLAERIGRPVQVLNLSCPGLSMRQEIALLRARGLPLQPDLVLVGYARNDPVPTDIVTAANADVWGGLHSLQLAQLWLKRRPLGSHQDWYRAGSEVYRQLELTFADFGRLGAAQPIVLVPLPVLSTEEAEQVHLQAVARLCLAHRVRCLDIRERLLPYLSAAPPQRDVLHFDAAGHRALAEALVVPVAELVAASNGERR